MLWIVDKNEEPVEFIFYSAWKSRDSYEYLHSYMTSYRHSYWQWMNGIKKCRCESNIVDATMVKEARTTNSTTNNTGPRRIASTGKYYATKKKTSAQNTNGLSIKFDWNYHLTFMLLFVRREIFSSLRGGHSNAFYCPFIFQFMLIISNIKWRIYSTQCGCPQRVDIIAHSLAEGCEDSYIPLSFSTIRGWIDFGFPQSKIKYQFFNKCKGIFNQ